MPFAETVKHELKVMGLYTAFFGGWFLSAMLFKRLVLAEYMIEFTSVSAALVGALVLAKVVLVLERVPLPRWLRHQPAYRAVIARTVLYSLGVILVLLIEHIFEVRGEPGGVPAALLNLLHHERMPHVIATTLCATGALLVFNAQSVLRAHLGESGLTRLFLSPLPPANKVA